MVVVVVVGRRGTVTRGQHKEGRDGAHLACDPASNLAPPPGALWRVANESHAWRGRAAVARVGAANVRRDAIPRHTAGSVCRAGTMTIFFEAKRLFSVFAMMSDSS